MVRWLLAMALAGCGRLGFDAVPSGDANVDTLSPDALPYDIANGECPPTYVATGGHCYRFVTAGTEDWLEAELACEADLIGAHLVIIEDDAEAELVDGAAPPDNFDHSLGVSDRVTEGVYLDVTGEPVTRLPWATSPDANEDCLLVRDDRAYTTVSCEVPNDYMCEYDGRPADPSAYLDTGD